MNNIQPISQAQFKEIYNQEIEANNPRLTVNVEGTDLYFRANAISEIAAIFSEQLSQISQMFFTANQYGNFLDQALEQYALSPRRATTYASGTCRLKTVQTIEITISEGAILTSGNLVYSVQSTVIIPAGSFGNISIVSEVGGASNQLPTGSELKLSIPIGDVDSLVVVDMTDGQSTETDEQVILRIEDFKQGTRGSDTAEDYKLLALRNQPYVTGCYVIYNLPILPDTLSIFVLSGSSDVDEILKTPPTLTQYYNRTATEQTIIETNVLYIQPNRAVNVTIYMGTSATQITSTDNIISVVVELVNNITLTTFLEQYQMTVEDLIKREVRRAFIQTQLFGNLVVGLVSKRVIFLNDIINSLNAGLNSLNGIYAQILSSVRVLYNGANEDIPINTNLVNNKQLYLVYDVLYSAISVSNAYVQQ